ncbi:hypothetical protein PV08_07610 [Exophiala spinifera]|uniref:t-SNARE coiled-coil homology domain-containing protein n=1 Tax=Exophiala spinifera TaxID=91928 RepID=A0A0D2B813_9EURO|nr:uncharacterized protein PV08_07610 [Exophiala spinifera]KIW14825.1 hypothetical protein PV08_07610 [Exophiala spinifera]
MSLTSALRPVALTFGAGARREDTTADSEHARPFRHEVDYLNLRRTLIRFQHLVLLTPSPSSQGSTELSTLQRQVQAELWSPLPYHRTKWLRNVEGARTLLLHLERKAQMIRVQRAKYEAIKDLADKRAIIKRLRSRIEEIGREIEMLGTEAWKVPVADNEEGDTLFDVLEQLDRPREQREAPTEKDDILRESKPVTEVEEEAEEGEQQMGNNQLFSSSTVRRRGGDQTNPAKASEAQTTGFSNASATERSLLNSSRVQEDISASMVSMAVQLKQQAQAMQFALQQDKSILGRAMEGLDVSVSSMEAASKNLAFLRRMSEEEGWLGRMKLYAMIFGMWVIAFLLVFVGPKIRF